MLSGSLLCTFGGVLEAAIANGKEQLALQVEVLEVGAVDTRIGRAADTQKGKKKIK
jgi:hypothetical protein